MNRLLKKYGFLAGLLIIFVATVLDTTETLSTIGKWFKSNHGPNAVIFLIFFSSGLLLNTGQLKSGLKDYKCILIALVIIYVAAPAIAVMFSLAPLPTGIKIGIFLVAVMPTTLSSGVVMTAAAGGNMAQALVITVLASGLSVLVIPFALSFLLTLIGDSTEITIDKAVIIVKIGLLVIFPLFMGMLAKFHEIVDIFARRFSATLQLMNQCLVLMIVWMALSEARHAIISGREMTGIIFISVFIFHGLLLVVAGQFVRFFKIGHGKRESILFMGGQKTLPLSVILQVSLFPQFGMALVVCVMHHIVHLIMDSFLVGRLRKK